MRICRGCGCTDDRPCRGEGVAGRWFTCCWVLMDFEIHAGRVTPLPTGICSRCAEDFEWDFTLMASTFDGSAVARVEELGLLGVRY